MKKSNIFVFLSICLVVALLAYFSYPLVTGVVDKRRQEEASVLSDSAEKLPEGELIIVMSADKATELINLYAEDLPLEDITVSFGDGIIVVEGTASRDALMTEELLVKHPNLWLIKGFIPESAELGVSFVATVENGGLKITPESLTLEKYKIPLGFLPLEIRDAVGEMITGQYVPKGFSLRTVEVENGKITVAMD
ncbi:MAG: hypothetical protein II350_06635 [Clostridia bacterium]|nr:hypothetical protein [Clostridia bacterium]